MDRRKLRWWVLSLTSALQRIRWWSHN